MNVFAFFFAETVSALLWKPKFNGYHNKSFPLQPLADQTAWMFAVYRFQQSNRPLSMVWHIFWLDSFDRHMQPGRVYRGPSCIPKQTDLIEPYTQTQTHSTKPDLVAFVNPNYWYRILLHIFDESMSTHINSIGFAIPTDWWILFLFFSMFFFFFHLRWRHQHREVDARRNCYDENSTSLAYDIDINLQLNEYTTLYVSRARI